MLGDLADGGRREALDPDRDCGLAPGTWRASPRSERSGASFVDLGAGYRNHGRDYRFIAKVVRDPEDRGLCHGIVLEEHPLDLVRGDILTAALDHVL